MSNITSLHISSAANWLTHELVHFLSWQILLRRKTYLMAEGKDSYMGHQKAPDVLNLEERRERPWLNIPCDLRHRHHPSYKYEYIQEPWACTGGRRQKFQPFNVLLYSVFWKMAWQHPRLSTYDSRSNIMEVYIWNCWKDVLTKWVMRFNIEILISNQRHHVGTLGTCLQLSVNDNMII